MSEEVKVSKRSYALNAFTGNILVYRGREKEAMAVMMEYVAKLWFASVGASVEKCGLEIIGKDFSHENSHGGPNVRVVVQLRGRNDSVELYTLDEPWPDARLANESEGP